MFLDEIEKDFGIENDYEKIRKELELEKYDEVEWIRSLSQIRVTIPAKVTNKCNWDKYISKMVKVIVRLREIVDEYDCRIP